MTSQRDLERTLDAFFAVGADEVPDRVIDGALLAIEHTRQRSALRVPWRSSDMSSSMKLVTTAAALLIAFVSGTWILGRGTGPGVGGDPSPTPSATLSPTPTTSTSPATSPPALTDTSNWVSFTSPRYGYQIARPPSWVATPATRNWVLKTDRLDMWTTASDQFVDLKAVYGILVTAWAVDVAPTTSEDDWITAFYAGSTAGCGTLSSDVRQISVDGHAGRLVVNDPCSDAEAFVFIDGRVHVFAIWRDQQIALLEAFLSTVTFVPTPPVGSAAPSAGPS